MKYRFYIGLVLGALLLAGSQPALLAEDFSVPWFVVAGGGGTTTAGDFSMTGTFGQWNVSAQPLTNGEFALTGGFWSILAVPEFGTTLFSDSFGSNSVDPTLWTATGDTVIETNGMMEVLNNAVDNGGVLKSVPFPFNPTNLITITRQVFLHAQPSSNTNYPGTYFMGQFGISIGALPSFTVNYANMDYGDGVTYMPRHGFFLARDGASPLYLADQSNVSAAITPIWDTWFTETVTYDPLTGIMEYFINNVSQTTFNVGILPPTNSPNMMLTFNAWGWWTGHEQLFENLVVTEAGATVSAPAIVLSGNLAFGGLPSGMSSNQTLTISNAGNAMLTVSNISYPAGFSGAFSGTIAAGSSQLVTVTFSPTAITNYGGTVTVNSDAPSGVNTIPISGFGASGTLTLVVDINGKGTVTPNLNGKLLIADKKYTLKAVAGSGYVFANWSGSIITNKNPLAFTMQPSTLLQANFVPSPFMSVKGTYNGLFATTNGVAEETAGMLKSLTVSEKGTYSGTLLIAGASHGISGTFSFSGQASNHISRTARQGGPLTAQMTLDLNGSPPQITGTVSGTNWTANLIANRATNNGAAEYTTVLAPTVFGLPGVPSGYGYVLMAKHAGVLALSGALPDGTVLTQTVPVDQTGEVPVYAALYGNTGLLTGWLDMSGGAPAGNLNWIKKAARTGRYTNGFTNLVIAQGAGWTNRSPAPAIDLPTGQLNLTGGILSTSLTFSIAVNGHNALTKSSGTPTNSLTGSINPRTGLLTIIFGNGDGKATTVGKGAVLQDTTNAAGFFLDKTNAGSVILNQ